MTTEAEAPTPPAAPAPSPPEPPATPPPAAPAAPPPTAPPAAASFDDWVKDPANATHVKALRDEAAANRVKAREAEAQRDAVLAALGITPDGAPPDPDKLAADLQASRQQLADLQRTTALQAAAARHGADLDLITPYLLGKGALAALDPTTDTFAADVDALVAAEVNANPKLKAGQAPAKGGADFAGGTGGQHIYTRDEIAALAKDPGEYAKHRDEIQRQVAAGLVT